MKGQVKCLEELIRFGADLNIRKKGDNALVTAARKSFFDCVTTLLGTGAKVDTAFIASIAKKLKKGTFKLFNKTNSLNKFLSICLFKN